MQRRVFVMLTAVLVAFGLVLPAGAAAREKAAMFDFHSGERVKGQISIDRGSDSIDVNAHLRELTPGYAYTLWAVIWNDPSQCSPVEPPEGDGVTPVCGEDDLGISAIRWAGIGGVANGGGNLNGGSTLVEGEIPDDDSPIPGALTDAEGAEIHFVVQCHGEALTGQDLVDQTTKFHGACNPGPDACVDVQFAVFK